MTHSSISDRLLGYFSNQVLVFLQNHAWPGKHRFFIWLCKHRSQTLIEHKINKKAFLVPVDEWCFWLEKGPNNYYLDEFIPFFDEINKVLLPVTFFDLGADIGTVSAIADKYCTNLQQIIAFEPNPKSFLLLKQNLQQTGKPVCCQNMAISDFDGFACFTSSNSRSIDHEGAIDTSKAGSTQVITLDKWLADRDLTVNENIAIKIDVEGQEAQAIYGAKELIRKANSAVILLEIHPDVLETTNTSPEQLFEALESIRPVKWYVPILGNQQIDRNRKFFSQFSIQQYDVIAVMA